MALTNDQITAQNFKDFYGQIRPYLNGTAHGGFTPIGTVISVMGKQAPHNFLVCDGTVYNIADYPELAAYFTVQFEASNFFGGDGVTTFAVPDLRGEFLRGAGTNSHAHGGVGADVGEHQEGTAHLYIGKNAHSDSEQRLWFQSNLPDDGTNINVVKNIDGFLKNEATLGSSWKMDGGTFNATGETHYYSRPTNTSVLYCIATKNIFMDAGCNYSTDEQVVGTWVDGKPIYQKTIFFNPVMYVSSTVWSATNEDVSNIENIISGEGYSVDGSRQSRPMCLFLDGVLKIMSGRDGVGSDSISGITYRYTKTTD